MEIPRHWRIQKQQYSLAGETCPHCNAKVFPPRPVCPYCGNGAGGQKPEKAFDLAGFLLSSKAVKVAERR